MMKVRNTFLVHDEADARMPGDIVRIEETRPLSKLKHFKIIEVIKEEERVTDAKSGKVMTRYTS
jgi:small subunit ribosomal protein S17